MPWHPCVNARDSITQADGAINGNFVTLSGDQHKVTSHCRVADGTWATWFDNLTNGSNVIADTGYNDMDTFTDSDAPVHVGYFPDDGSPATVYDLTVNYIWDWSAPGRYSDVSLCAIRFPSSSKYYGNNVHCDLNGWNTGVLDVQVRTDGTTVWVVILAQESVMYPFLYGYRLGQEKIPDRCGILHPTIFSYALGEGCLVSGSTIDGSPAGDGDAPGHQTHTAPDGGTFWLQTGVVGIDNPEDAGLNSSFRWQPARVSVWAGDLGGFTFLGVDDAQFCNNSANANKGIGLCSGIEAAASPAEPGVCHVLWAEAGGWYDFLSLRGQRISYTRWGRDAWMLQRDLGSASTDQGNGWPRDGIWQWTAEMIIRNDHGSPAAIIMPWQATSDESGDVTGGPLPPGYYDLSTGSPVLLQVMDESLFPTPAESGIAGDVGLIGALVNLDGNIFSVTDPHRRHFASSLYTDPTDVAPNPSGGGEVDLDVYLLALGFNTAGNNFSPGGGGAAAFGFYRIVADGSQPFEFMDGIRQTMYSILPVDPGFGPADFVSDPGNVWMPTHGGNVWHLPRTCTRTWELLQGFPDVPTVRGFDVSQADWVGLSDNEQLEAPTSPPALVYDGAGDWIAAAGIISDLTLDGTTPTQVAALRAKICRCCVPCAPRTGMHVWERI